MKPGPSPKLQLRYIPPLREPHGFPCFSDGDVLVVLHSENTRYHLRLHSLTLRNVSTVLDGLLLTQADENIPKKMLGPNPTELVFCLELSNDPKSCWGLQRGVSAHTSYLIFAIDYHQHFLSLVIVEQIV